MARLSGILRIHWIGGVIAGGLLLEVLTPNPILQQSAAIDIAEKAPMNRPCDLGKILKPVYEEMSAGRTQAIEQLVSIPRTQIEPFRAAYNTFTQVINSEMNREIAALGRYFGKRILNAQQQRRSVIDEMIEIEEAKIQALRAYVTSLSEFMPNSKVEELARTDLHLIRTVEVRLGTMVYQIYYGSSR